MEHIVFNEKTMEFRFGSGIFVYSEVFRGGRLIASDYMSAGMPFHENERRAASPLTAFSLEVDGQDATFDWEFAGFEKSVVPDGRPCGELRLIHPRLRLELTVRTLTGEGGMMTRELFLKNTGEHPCSLTRVAPLCGGLWQMSDDVRDYLNDYDTSPFRVGSFRERYWGTEGNFDWLEIPSNSAVDFGSYSGRSGHGHPFAVAESRILGGFFLCQMEWSSSWRFRFFADYNHQGGGWGECLRLCFSLAPDAPAPLRVIEPGEKIELPAVHFGFGQPDFDAAVQALHTYQRDYLLAKPRCGTEWVSYDGWGYHGSDYKEDILFREIDRAADLGAELYMVDAGWYGIAGTDWSTTVGDWTTSRLPHDLYPIIDRAHARGMKFGLWVEPEAVGRESILAKEHPEWMMLRYGERQERCLDLSRPEVEKWVEDSLTDIVRRYQLDLLRLDYNNQHPNEGGFNEREGYQENLSWRYTEAIHRIFTHLKEKFPTLELENCASGGGRTDLGMQKIFSKVQITDWYMFPRLARIFNGMTLCLPPECLLNQYGQAAGGYKYGSAETQLQLSILGAVKISGIAPIDEPVNPVLWEMIRKYLDIHKNFIRPIQRKVRVFHHTPVVKGMSGRGWVAQEFTTPDGLRGYASVVRLPGTEENSFCLRLKGLRDDEKYRVTFAASGRVLTADGFTLTSRGLDIPLGSSLASELLLYEKSAE